MAPLMRERQTLVIAHRTERHHLNDQQDQRWQVEQQQRSDRLRKGFGAVLDYVTGRTKAIRKANEAEALDGMRRDRDQRDRLVLAQMVERRELQKRIHTLRQQHQQDRRILARDVTQYLRRQEREIARDHTPERDRKPRNRPKLRR